jgi:regulator of RNase E activity RraB
MWFRNKYHHDECAVSWQDEHSCMCNDRCPSCNAEIEPEDSDDLSFMVFENERDDSYYGPWGVYFSPESAEHDPDYVRVKSFYSRTDAEAHAAAMRNLF